MNAGLDPISVFRREVFRPIVITVIPGLTAIAPFLLVLDYYVSVADLPAAAITGIILMAAVAVGFVIEDLGSRIETAIWHFVKGKTGDETWYRFLATRFEGKPIALEYMADLVLRMKFENSFAIALIVACGGLVWIHILGIIGSRGATVSVIGLALFIAAYLIFESWSGVKLLKELRSKLVTT